MKLSDYVFQFVADLSVKHCFLVTGGGASSVDFPVTAGAAQTTLNGSYNAFVSKLSADGSALVYGTLIGGTVVTETVFTLPGLGKFVVDAVLRRVRPLRAPGPTGRWSSAYAA